MRLGKVEVVQRIEGQHGVGSVWPGLQWRSGERGWRLGFCYLRIKILHRTGTIYGAFDTYS
jgi:hypothetical protein